MTFKNYIKVIALAFVIPTLSQASTNDFGPMMTYAQSPLQSNSLTPILRSGFNLPAGTKEIYFSGTTSSVWVENNAYHADYYQNTLLIGGKWQITDKWQTDLQYRWNFSANNHLDSVTDKFHSIFGIDDNGRNNVAHNQNNIVIPEYGINITNFDNETISSAFTLYTQYQLIDTQHHGLSLGGSLYYNHVGSGPFKDSSFEQGIQANYSYNNLRHTLYTTLGASYRHDKMMFSDIPYHNVSLAMLLGYKYALDDNQELMIEYHWYEGATNDIPDLSDASNEVVLGYRYNWQQTSLEFVVLENMINMDNSADISFSLSLRHRFN